MKVKPTKRQLKLFQQFYPETFKAMGGSEGVQRWLNNDDRIPLPVMRILRKETDVVVSFLERQEELDRRDMMGVFCNAYY